MSNLIARHFHGERLGAPVCSYGGDALLWASLAVAAVSAGVGAAASYEQGQQQSKIASYNKKANENAAAMAQQQASLNAEREATRQRRFLAAQHVAQASSGVLTGEGSPLVVAMDSAREAERDLQLIKYGGEARAYSFETEGRLQGGLSRAYDRGSYINAGSNLLASAANIGSIYATRQRPASATPASVISGV